MWNLNHLKGEGWLAHTLRSLKLAGLLLLSGVAMVIHIVIPFWEQPKVLQACSVAESICEEMDKRKQKNIKM